MRLDQASVQQLQQWQQALEQQYQQFQQAGLNLDLTRGKPGPQQLELANALDGILQQNYHSADGTDCRNYGGIDGLQEAKALFAPVLGVTAEETLVAGNSSLSLMYFCVQMALHFGPDGAGSSWAASGETVKFLAPVPGYDRHFAVCEELGIEMINVAMTDQGPDMDQVEALLAADPMIKGIWCVPRFSNPTGIVYSDEVVQRIAKLDRIAGPGFRVFWDNAYAVHPLYDDAPALANIMDYCREAGSENLVYQFGSTSKVTFAGAGVSFMASSAANLAVIKQHLGFTQIGPDKVNQLRHVKFLGDIDGIHSHMRKQADILRPRFEAVLKILQREFADSDMGQWTQPRGGYFIAFDTRPGLANKVIAMAAAAGVKLTPAGATFPGGIDPEDCNIRLAPSYPDVAAIEQATEVFACCVKLASVNQRLQQAG